MVTLEMTVIIHSLAEYQGGVRGVVASLEIRVNKHSLGEYHGRKRGGYRKKSEEKGGRMGTALWLASGSCGKLMFLFLIKLEPAFFQSV